MLVDNHKFEQILDKNCLKITRTRRALYESLAGYNRPVSIKELVSSLSGRMDPVTVYRNAEVFESVGIVKKVYTGWRYRLELSERFRPHHHHFTCLRCGRIIPIELGNIFEHGLASAGRKKKLKITGHEVELRGYCQACA